MKVLWLGKRDDSGTTNRICRAVNRMRGELTMRCVTRYRSVFRYEEDICLERDGEAGFKTAVREAWDADWICHLGDDDYGHFRKLCVELGIFRDGHPYVEAQELHLRGKRLGTRHSGTLYRTNPGRYQRWDDGYGMDRIFLPCDLYRLLAGDERARPFVQPQDHVAASAGGSGGTLRVCHCPSNRAKKHTADIKHALVPLETDIIFNVIDGVPFDECFARMRRHHVLIDQLTPEHGGFGAAVMEALSQGVVPVLDDHHVGPEVDRWIPRPPTVTVQSEQELVNAIRRMRDDRAWLASMQTRAVDWAHKYLGDEFTYSYFADAFR